MALVKRIGTSLALLVMVLGLATLLIWGLKRAGSPGSGKDESTFVVEFVGLVANVIMGGAAIWAVLAAKAWREQIAGQSRHDVAKKAVVVFQHAVPGITDMLRNWTLWHESAKPEAHLALLASVGELQKQFPALHELEIEVRALWGDDIAEPFREVRIRFATACMSMLSELRGDPTFRALNAQQYGGGTLGGKELAAIERLVALMFEWAGPHTGREGARVLGGEEVAERTFRIVLSDADGVRLDDLVEDRRLERSMARRGENQEAIRAAVSKLQAKREQKRMRKRKKDDRAKPPTPGVVESEKKEEAEALLAESEKKEAGEPAPVPVPDPTPPGE